MGWEWHNRERDRKGRFDGQRRGAQLHIRVSELEIEQIRAYANSMQMDISEFILWLVAEYRAKALTPPVLTGGG